MSLEDKTILIDQLIKEDSDNTIRVYLDILKELETIESTFLKKQRA